MSRSRPLWQGNPRWPWVRRAIWRERERQSRAMREYLGDQARPEDQPPVTEDYREAQP